MALVPTVRDGDWVGLRRCISKLSMKLGPDSVPTFAGLKLTGLTSGRVPIMSTGGLFADDALFTFDPVAHTLTISGLTFGAGSITDATGTINFGNENLITTGTLGAGAITGTTLFATAAGGLTLGTDAATNIAGKIKLWSAGTVNWSTTLTAGVQTADANYTLPLARPTANSQALLGTNADPSVLSWGTDFGANNLLTSGTLTVGADTDIINTLGRWKMGYESTFGADAAILAHYDMFTSTDFALAQDNAGDTWLNSGHFTYLCADGAYYARLYDAGGTPTYHIIAGVTFAIGGALGSERIEITQSGTDPTILNVATDYSNLLFNVEGSITATNVITGASLVLNGKATTYNSIITVSGGVPSEVATVDLTGQASSISATTIYTPAASGMFRLSIVLQLTTPGSVSSALGTNFTVTYTEPDGSVAQSVIPLLSSETGVCVVPATGNVGNLTTSQVKGTAIIYAKTGVAIQYAVGFAANASGAYSVHLKLEAL